MIPLIIIEGPTASGKTDLALILALELGAQIISADSRQVYRHMDIGTAKPSKDELNTVPHHLIDIIEPDESYNVGRFCVDSAKIIRELHDQGIPAIICGGTGLYVQGLLQGIFPQVVISPEIRLTLMARLKNEGLSALYQELVSVDPAFARQISSQDRQRILRGLEVYLASGIPISEHWRTQIPQQLYKTFRILIDPPRETLYERINNRIELMLEQGLLCEITSLLENGYDAQSPGLNSLGYKEFLPHLLERASLAECSVLAAQHSRNYAKRQCTWYRKYKFDLTFESKASIISDIAGFILTQLYKI